MAIRPFWVKVNKGNPARGNAGRQRGFSLVELMMAIAIVGVLSAIAIPILTQAVVRSEVRAVVSEGRTIHTAFKTYYLDHDQYPDAVGGGAFDIVSFDPLKSGGYYRGGIGRQLESGQPDAYGAPDGGQEFWLEMTLDKDTTKRFLVADSNNAPIGGGDQFDGVYAFDNGVRIQL
jgi:prepilin-type N-terminal cleavage/methylation domain-containing protein